jgi:hypothetical protein
MLTDRFGPFGKQQVIIGGVPASGEEHSGLPPRGVGGNDDRYALS